MTATTPVRLRVRRGSVQTTAISLGFLALILVMWQVLPTLLNTPSYVLPTLSNVLAALFDPAALPRYLDSAAVTMTEVFVGLGIGIAIGIVGAVVLTEVPILYRILFPYIVAIESIPKVALAPLFIIWFGFGLPSKIVVVVLLTFFPILVNTLHGMKGVDPDRYELFRINGASRFQVLRKLILPSALPSMFSGLELAMVNAMIGALVAEFVGAQKGLGVLILQAQGRMDTAAVFALLIILSLIGIVLNLTVRFLRRKAIYWVAAEKG